MNTLLAVMMYCTISSPVICWHDVPPQLRVCDERVDWLTDYILRRPDDEFRLVTVNDLPTLMKAD